MVDTPKIAWDLSSIFKGFDDPEINKTIDTALKKAESIEKNYKGKIDTDSVTPKDILKLLQLYEEVLLLVDDLLRYSRLAVSADSTNEQAQKLYNTYQTTNSRINGKLAFITIELGNLLSKKGESFLNSQVLAHYKQYLVRIVLAHPHILSEAEEQLIIEKDQYGIDQWYDLEQAWVSTRQFKLNIKGEEKTVPYVEARAFFQDTDREIRKESMTKVLGTLAKDSSLFSTCLRNICGDHVTVSKRRKYPTTLTESLIDNDLTEEIVRNMLTAIEKNVDICRELYLLKAKVLGTEKLLGEDIIAPVPVKTPRDIPWEEAKSMVIGAYAEFDEEFGSIAEYLFDNNRIDGSPRHGKRAGAFCSPWYNGKGAFVFLTYNGKLDDVGALAHEIGHAIQAHKTTANQKFVVHMPSFALAETASEFGTMIITEKLLKKSDPDTKIYLLFNVLENLSVSIFNTCMGFRFEESLYNTLEKGEYLNEEKISKLLVKARTKYYGDTVEYLPEQEYVWTYVPHYYIPRFRYYNYLYAVGELIVLSLYAKYLEEGKTFIPKYKALLAAGGSRTPEEQLKMLGFDITSPEFWEMGLKEVRRLLDELKSLLG
ncbi:MAG: M3 family oligoendopeptidase [Candidatus Odinarchaeota archaeon]